jgi:HK97 gp10 family phage protein
MAGTSIFEVKVTVTKSVLEGWLARLPGVEPIISLLGSQAVEEMAKGYVPYVSGFLHDSIRRDVQGSLWSVKAHASYAGFVEFGTSKMAARPFLNPAMEAVDWDGIVRQAFRSMGIG